MKKIKNILLVLSIFLLSLITINTTIAYLITETSPVKATFIPQLKPTGDIILYNHISHDLGEDYVIPDNIIYEYEINLGEEYKNADILTSEGALKADENGVLKVTLKDGEGFAILDIFENTEVSITTKTSLNGFKENSNETTKVITIKPNVSATVDFTFNYEPTSVKTDNFTLTGTKVLNREWTEEDTFTFVLEQKINNEWVEIGTKTITYSEEQDFNKFDLTDIISSLELDKISNHDFRFYEKVEELDETSYDPTINTFRLVVTDETMDGSLELSKVEVYENMNLVNENGIYSLSVEFNNENIKDDNDLDYVDEPENSELINKIVVVKDDKYDIDTVLTKFEGLSLNYTYTVYDNAGNVVETTKVRTGDYIEINTDNKSYIFYMVLKGDVNGDGDVAPIDYVKIKNHIMEEKLIVGDVYKLAADYNDDTGITPLDYVKVKNHIMNGGN